VLYTAPHNLMAAGYARVNDWQDVAEYFAKVVD
jgi:5'(3')-deoxyribonucleotidase